MFDLMNIISGLLFGYGDCNIYLVDLGVVIEWDGFFLMNCMVFECVFNSDLSIFDVFF